MITVTSVEELESILISRSKVAVAKAQDLVYEAMNFYLLKFYVEYEPELYDRTYQLLSCCVRFGINVSHSGDEIEIEAEVGFDDALLNYITGMQPSGLQVLEAANNGGHGAMGLKVIYVGDVHLMDDSITKVTPHIINILKSAFK